jgi:hypothetical protein
LASQNSGEVVAQLLDVFFRDASMLGSHRVLAVFFPERSLDLGLNTELSVWK